MEILRVMGKPLSYWRGYGIQGSVCEVLTLYNTGLLSVSTDRIKTVGDRYSDFERRYTDAGVRFDNERQREDNLANTGQEDYS